MSASLSSSTSSAYYIKQTNNKIEFSLVDLVDGVFLSSIQQNLNHLGALINKNGTKIVFYANTIVSLADLLISSYVTYENAVCMVAYLSQQIMYLEKREVVVVGLDLKDVFMVGDNVFFIANPRLLVPIYQDKKHIEFALPFYKPQFISPQINAIVRVPDCSVLYVSARYCLVALIIHAMGIDSSMACIRNTRLYWFLYRCGGGGGEGSDLDEWILI
jgi:hypothetical protein